ncbi:MAG: threonine ammonia-lyase [Thermomicrobiales bacterium]
MKAVGEGVALAYEPIPFDEIRAARERSAGTVMRTPLVRLDVDDAPAEIWLKLECLQPIRSFKLRGATNAMLAAGREALAGGVWTASAGNMAQGVAWAARALGVPCAVVVPETAPETKIAAVRRYGGAVITVSVAAWLEIFRTRHRDGMTGVFVHPYSDPAVMAGNGVAGLEILEDLPEVDAVVVPWGGGGLCCGIASAIKALRPACKVYACEVDTGAPLAPSLAAGRPVEVPFNPNFIDGIGAPFVNEEMFDLAARLIDGSLVVTTAETAAALRLILERTRVVPEGAGAVATAAALAGKAGGGKVVCLVSGGNIDPGTLVTILQGEVP